MTDYSELVRKMRTCIGYKKCFIKECRYWSKFGCMDGNICCDAAAAIEELEAEIRKSMQNCAECGDRCVEVVRCIECRWGPVCMIGQHLGLDGFCSKGEREVQDESAGSL